jgi:hypothetical protein
MSEPLATSLFSGTDDRLGPAAVLVAFCSTAEGGQVLFISRDIP